MNEVIAVGVCAGCEEEPVAAGQRYCGFCATLHEELRVREEKRFAFGRVNTGVVPFEEYDPGKPASCIAVGVVFLGAFCSTMLTMTVLWFGFRSAWR